MYKERGRKDYNLIKENLENIESIISACLVLDGEDDSIIEEIHIVSNGKRSPKQLSRDIQSILMATYAIKVDYKKISIAELPHGDFKKITNRIKVESVCYENNGSKASVTVNLSDRDKIFSYSDEGLNTSRNIDRMLVNSTLKNVERAWGVNDVFILEDVKSVDLSIEKVVLVIIICVLNGEEKRMCGSCIVRLDHKQAVVKATLDAINRCIVK